MEASPRPTKSDWYQVIVVSNGVVIAEPWNMTPRELARSQIIDRSPRLIGFGCEGMGGYAMVAEEESDFPMCRDIHSIE